MDMTTTKFRLKSGDRNIARMATLADQQNSPMLRASTGGKLTPLSRGRSRRADPNKLRR